MKKLFPLLTLLLTGSASAVFAQTSHLFRPEEDKANGDVIRNEEDAAWDGEYASQNKEYNPLFIGKTDTIKGDTVIVWARLRGYAVQTKAIEGSGEQKELNWTWDKPTEWKWVKLGNYDRTQAGTAIIIIRGPDAAEKAGLDAVLFTSDPDIAPAELTQKELIAKITPAK